MNRTTNDKDEDLNGPHKFVATCKAKPAVLVCCHCGHVPLRNHISEVVTALGCGYRKHPKFKAWLESIGRKN